MDGGHNHSLRYFSGDGDTDHKEYQRWKSWALNKMMVMDKLPANARGSFIWTLLQGRALEVVEHLKPEEYQKENGDAVLFKLLDQRWPQKDRADEIGEHVSEVFLLRSKENETVRAWCSRAREVFDRCQRKASVSFPEEARGWIVLNSSGMTEEQRAVVLARCAGSLKFDEVAQAMRSCFPEFVVPRRRAMANHYVEPEHEDWWYETAEVEPQGVSEEADASFNDVELFLAEHAGGAEPASAEVYQEDEVAEVLATTWKDRRKELSQLQKSRKFGQAQDMRRSFRVEVEELKKRTQCRRCGKTGHWARECRAPPSAYGASGAGGAASSSTSGAAMVQTEHFICSLQVRPSIPSPERTPSPSPMLSQLRQRRSAEIPVCLVSSPGYAVLDSGCGRSVVGEETLRQFRSIWNQRGLPQPAPIREVNSFRYGNGQQETSTQVVEMPVQLAHRRGVVRAAVIAGRAPLLMSRPAMKKLGAVMDFAKDELYIMEDKIAIPLTVNEAGQYVVPVAEFKEPGLRDREPAEPEVAMQTESQDDGADQRVDPGHLSECQMQSLGSKGDTEVHAVAKSVTEAIPKPPSPLMPDARKWNPRQWRQFRAAAKKASEVSKKEASAGSKLDVVEVFSSSQFAEVGAIKGLECVAADLHTGWDFRRPRDRAAMRTLVEESKPRLLVLNPPCTYAGGWYHLSRGLLSEQEAAHKRGLIKLFVHFCVDLAQIQLAAGRRVLFELPKGSYFWNLPRVLQLQKQMTEIEVDLCSYGLQIPDGPFVRRSVRLLVSHDNMRSLQRRCCGSHQGVNVEHVPLHGRHPRVGLVSRFADKYPKGFVRAVLRVTKEIAQASICLVQTGTDHECLVAARVQALSGQKEDQMRESLLRLHNNMGHPAPSALCRVLKHGGASQAAIEMAKQIECDVCKAQRKPESAPPAQGERVSRFNERVGIDVKYLTGWQANQRIPALNIVDHASSFQIMVPLPSRETSAMLRQNFLERWVSWAGQPEQIVMDPAQTNVSDAMTNPQELAGSSVLITAAEAHWQLGKVEVHGGWFNRCLEKVIADCAPQNRTEWLECVQAAHCKNELIQVYGMTPAQFVFGRNPRIPHNLLDEPLSIVPATAPLHEDSVAKAVAIRQSARQAVIQLQDAKALRLSLAARPRKVFALAAGDQVAYWRTQKSREGVVEFGGRWCGPAVVLGHVGRNLVVVHKRQIFRCAPEQVRPATSEEKCLSDTPHLELLGIKHLIDSGALQSRQYIDLVPDGAPPRAADEAAQPMQVDDSTESANRGSIASPAVPPQVVFRREHTAVPIPEPNVSAHVPPQESAAASDSQQAAPSATEGRESGSQGTSDADYGPVRRRVSVKSSPMLLRPQAMLPDDFSDMMQEVVPQLISQALETTSASDETASGHDDPMTRGTKREASAEPPEAASPKRAAPASEVPLPGDEALCVQPNAVELFSSTAAFETLVINQMNKRSAKEVPATGNPLDVQPLVDEAKTIEWNTIESRHAARIVFGQEAADVREKLSHRIMGSRFVCTWKQEEDAPRRMKARWCLQGHLDPDLQAKALAGDLQSPTLSQVGRSMLFQILASKRWTLRLGDIKGAFLSSGALPQEYKPLYASLPPGGIPGVPPGSLIEVLGRVYGLNDAPSAWQRTLDRALQEAGFERSRLDPCLYYLRHAGQLVGIYGVHVDDCATGGFGDKYERALEMLKGRFEFRKWRLGDGDFCGARYRQDPQTFEITLTQESFVDKIRPLRMTRRRAQERHSPLTDDEIKCLRAINGSLNWLSSQSRPDLATQVSFSQQSFPKPTVNDALAANNAVRRARQHRQLSLTFKNIPLDKLTVLCHSDAAYANGRDGATQAGYVIGFTSQEVDQDQVAPWSPAYWKSYRLPRVVSSTLSAEAQALATASGMAEWTLLLLSEAIDGPSHLRSFWSVASKRKSVFVTDCKSLYDHLMSRSAPTLDEKRTALDIVILRESLQKTQGSLRWVPTDRMVADSMTKESADALDMLRACLRQGSYQISEEGTILQWRSDEKERRKLLAQGKHADSAEDTTPASELHPELAWVGQGIHGAERREGVRILARSIMTGDFHDMCNEAIQEFRGLRRDYQAAGTWSTVQELYRDYSARNGAAVNDGAQGMTDACKRQRDLSDLMDSDGDESWLGLTDIEGGPNSSDPRGPPRGPPPPKPVNAPAAAASPSLSLGSAPTTPENAPVISDPSLNFPEGITNMIQWGDTVIGFGKYKGRNTSYAELARDVTKDALSYKRWLIGHQTCATGQCKDVASYLKRRQLLNDLPLLCAGNPIIPGTSEPRSFKSSSSPTS
ncbi:RE2 [Symbiodinium sp. CCMP2592]|nr:RE2 [Symbiodinium sp. CCMP2592]